MVEFCKNCKGSLPLGDLTVRGGRTETSHDYICPNCGRPANPPAKMPRKRPDPDPERDMVISGGETRIE